ncbi:MAG: carbohydrate binding domain-containing protein [Pseudomonadota bacterium]
MKKHPTRIAQAIATLLCASAAATALAHSATVYYKAPPDWRQVNIHYGINGNWTGEPGVDMAGACVGWRSKTVELGEATSWQAAFNDGAGHWDNRGGADYQLGTGTVSIDGGHIGTGNPCAASDEPFRLGVMYRPTQSTFSIWSPDSANVALELNGKRYAMNRIADVNGYTSVYSVTVDGDHHLAPYHFHVNGVTSRDPYGVMVQAGSDNNIVLDLSRTALPGGWSPTPALAQRVDSVIYETHVRDFTVDASSGVPAAQRATYAGLTLAGTTVNGVPGAPSTGIDHLVEMGITHLQILPVFDFGSCTPADVASRPDCYDWGYSPVNYNVPEERYSLTPNDYVGRVREFKAMVDRLHRRGIRVVLDVVYNHTLSKDVLGNISGAYYNATDMSATGNSLDASQPMVARMIRDSLEYWVKQYNVDGFRFDLMGVFDTSVVADWGRHLNATYPERNLLLYGEPWNGGIADPLERQHVRYGSVGTIADAHIGVFNGAYRDAIKNANNSGGGRGGFIFNQGATDSGFGAYDPGSKWPGGAPGLGAISAGVKGSPLYSLPATQLPNIWDAMYTAAPEQSINYVDVHDDLCLADKVAAWAADNGQSANTGYLNRLQQFAMSMVLTSQGIPLLHGGSEMQRTKQGVSNSYQSPDSINAYDWHLLNTHQATYQYVRKLIALRKAHAGFRFNSWDGIERHVQADQRSASLVVTTIDGAANGDDWNREMLIFNSGADQEISLPPGQWRVAVEKSSADEGKERVVDGSVTAAGTAITVLHQ